MNELFSALDRWQQQAEEIALATVVRVRGSAPRRAGARLGLTRSGKMAGSVSGGCVESDVLERARAVLDSGRPEMTRYDAADELGFDVGLPCGGSIDVLITPFEPTPAWQALRRALESRQPVSLITAIEPLALLGHQRVVLLDGTVAGSIDPELDPQLASQAPPPPDEGGTQLLRLPWQGEDAHLLIESFPAPPRLFIVGATHTAIHLCRLAKTLGFDVHVIDVREGFASEERFPDADQLLRTWPDKALAEAGLDARSFVVVLAHDPKFDHPALMQATRSGAVYVGAIGSQATHERRRAELRRDGLSDAELDRIHAPIGLDIGGRSPEEIALSILAEMLAIRSGRRGGPLRERTGPIHDED